LRQARPAAAETPEDTPIPEQVWQRVPADELVTLVSLVLTAHDFPEYRARMAAEALCHGDLTGSSDSGVAELTSVHLPAVKSGYVRPTSR
jgi:LDH2 family malate/lactate/ureidoglycolate dehydrogenase